MVLRIYEETSTERKSVLNGHLDELALGFSDRRDITMHVTLYRGRKAINQTISLHE